MKRIVLPALLALLTGCGGTGSVIDGCAGWRAITVSRADVLTDDTARQLLAHNLAGQRRGCW